MDATIKAVANLAVEAIATIAFFAFLIFYLKRVFFVPVAKILEERRRQTEGLRDLAQKAQQMADKKTSEFDAAIQLVRTQIMQENDTLRRQWSDEQAKTIAQARSEAERQVLEAKEQIAAELETAKLEIAPSVARLSSQIIDSLLSRRAA